MLGNDMTFFATFTYSGDKLSRSNAVQEEHLETLNGRDLRSNAVQEEQKTLSRQDLL